MNSQNRKKGGALLATIAVITAIASLVIAVGKNHLDIEPKVSNKEIPIERVDDAIEGIEVLKSNADNTDQYTEEGVFGGTNDIPDLRALYEDSLASRITSSATSFTLVRGTDKEGNTLASSTYPFIIDEGLSTEEFVIADCTGTTCTNVTRGVSIFSGTTTIASLQKTHGRGASVKITDGPILLMHNRLLQGIMRFPNLLNYKDTVLISGSSPTTTLTTKYYVDNVALSGAPDMNATTKGIAEQASGAEAANSTLTGNTTAPLALTTAISTSSPFNTGVNVIPVTGSTGKLDYRFIATSTSDAPRGYLWTASTTFTGTGLTINATSSINATSTNNAPQVNNSVMFGTNTVNIFTAGETISASTLPIPVMYATSSAKVYQVDGNVASTSNFIGYALNNAVVNGNSYVQTSGIVSGFTGLTAGLRYYVQDAVGTIGTTVGTAEIYAGTAISTTAVMIEQNDAGSMQYLGSQVLTCTGGSAVDNTINQPWARHAIVEINTSNGNAIDGSVFISKIGKTSGTVAATDSSGGSAVVSVNASWTGGSLRLTANTGDTCSVTAYYYR